MDTSEALATKPIVGIMALEFLYQGEHQSITPGLYFGMPENLYHAIPAVSSSGMKNILVSPPDFYFNSWLNPLRDEDAEDEDAKEWRRFGRASHTRILEGKTVFDTLYCVEFLAPEGCLDTVSDMRKFCSENGIDTKGSSKWAKPDWINQIKMVAPHALIAEIEKEKYYRETGGKIQMSEKEMRRIEIAAAMIEKHPQLQHCFTGGHAEVSVVWYEDITDPSTGEVVRVWFKARFDYLKPRAIVDLKTFTNMQNKPIDMALYNAMAGLKYHIQVGHYTNAARHAALFAQEGVITTYGQRFTPTPAFIEELAKGHRERTIEDHDFFFVFQKKGGAPLARGKKFPRTMGMMKCAEASIQQAIGLFLQYSAEFGTGIWVDKTGITDFEDSLFPVWSTEI